MISIDVKKHLWYYSGLLIVSVLALSLLWMTAYDKALQMAALVLLSLFYILWGLLHHFMHHDLHMKIVLEYILIGALGISIAFFILG